jgi:hypothetical protein
MWACLHAYNLFFNAYKFYETYFHYFLVKVEYDVLNIAFIHKIIFSDVAMKFTMCIQTPFLISDYFCQFRNLLTLNSFCGQCKLLLIYFFETVFFLRLQNFVMSCIADRSFFRDVYGSGLHAFTGLWDAHLISANNCRRSNH